MSIMVQKFGGHCFRMFFFSDSGISGAIRIEPSSQTVEEGQNVELTCLIDGYSGQPVTWHRQGGRPLPPNHQVRVTNGRRASIANRLKVAH